MSMYDVLTVIFNIMIASAVPALGGFALWLVYGRKKKAEDKAVGVLRQMAVFKGASTIDSMQRRIR